MGNKPKAWKYTDIIAGIATLLVALALTVATLLIMKQCAGNLESSNKPSTESLSTPPTTVTAVPSPTLAPNPFSPDDFLYENGYLSCPAGNSWLGVDVSEHQGNIDWQQVADAGIQFAMIRMAYRGWGSEGVIRADAKGYNNLLGASEAGLPVGVYFFSQAITVEEAVEEARFLLTLLDGRELELPVVFDWETVSSQDARTANMNRKTLNACARAFCQEIEAAGYDAMVYFNLDLTRRLYRLLPLQEAGYDFWLAMYTDSLTYAYQVKMWQYTSEGSVPGIKGKVDLNLYFPGA